MREKDRRIDLAPLRRELQDRGLTPTELLGVRSPERRNYARAESRGTITVDFADRICVKYLGVHPATVFGDLFWEGAL